jgi:hypothetical protein
MPANQPTLGNFQTFIAKLKKKGYGAASNRYLVNIQPNSAGLFTNTQFQKLGITNVPEILEDLRYLCTACQLPGKEIATSEGRTFGPVVKYPYVEIYGELPMTFICTNGTFKSKTPPGSAGDIKYPPDGFQEKKFFDAWIQTVIPSDTHDANFMNEYSTTIQIFQLNRRNQKIYGVKLLNAFPIGITEQEVSADGAEQYITVSLSYDHWENI